MPLQETTFFEKFFAAVAGLAISGWTWIWLRYDRRIEALEQKADHFVPREELDAKFREVKEDLRDNARRIEKLGDKLDDGRREIIATIKAIDLDNGL